MKWGFFVDCATKKEKTIIYFGKYQKRLPFLLEGSLFFRQYIKKLREMKLHSFVVVLLNSCL